MLLQDAPTQQRIYGLDILRAFAIISVMLSHSYEYTTRNFDVRYYWALVPDGVGLFFVLSGFLIGGILIRTVCERTFSLKELWRFWTRRWLRTLPNYYLILILLTALYRVKRHEWPPQLADYFTFTQCFASPHPLFFGEAWSLAIEEWFYIIVPAGLFLVLWLGNNKRHILYWILFILIAGTGIRVLKVAQHDYFADGSFETAISKQVITRMDNIMYGMLGAWISRFRPAWWLRHKKALFISGIIILIGSRIAIVYSTFFAGYLYYSMAAIGTLFLLPRLSTLVSGKGSLYRFFTFISIISYSMYLTNHMIVQRALMPRLLGILHIGQPQNAVHSAIALILFWSVTILISWALYRFWERPVLRLRDRLHPDPHRSAGR